MDENISSNETDLLLGLLLFLLLLGGSSATSSSGTACGSDGCTTRGDGRELGRTLSDQL